MFTFDARRCGAAAAAALGLMMVLASTSAEAYSYRTCDGKRLRWNKKWTNMDISTSSFPAGSAWDARLQNAMWHWNNVKGSTFDYYVRRDTDGKHKSGNDRNEVYLDNSLSGSTLAVTRTSYHCYWLFGWHYGIDETDIGFNNNNVVWQLGAIDYDDVATLDLRRRLGLSLDNVPVNFEAVALHELGHALGLKHEDDLLATMNAIYPGGATLGHSKEADPLGDDREGARHLYPDSTTERDVAASVFEQLGSDQESLVSSQSAAARGSTTTIEFTFSNQSTQTVNFDIRFYLSSNNFISSADRVLGTNTGAWGSPGFTGTFSRTLYIPSDVAPGEYYIGFIVDYNGSLAENHEGNNAIAMPRKITIN